MRLKHLIALCVGVFVFALALPLHAQDAAPTVDPATITDDEVNAVAAKMYCLECENIPLDVCGTQACIQWRQEIRLQLAAGRTENEILEYFRVNHGEQALAVPGDPLLRGLATITPYVLALLAVAAGGAFLWQWQRRATDAPNNTGNPATASSTPTDDYQSRLERDLNDL